jgi:hypothetical protein
MSSKADKRKEKKESAGRAPEGTGNKNPASTEATPMSAEKWKSARKEKKRKGDEHSSPSASKTKSQKRNSDPDSPDISVEKTEDDAESDSDFDRRTNKGLMSKLFPKPGDESVDSDFHGPDYGLSVHATRADLNDLLARGKSTMNSLRSSGFPRLQIRRLPRLHPSR